MSKRARLQPYLLLLVYVGPLVVAAAAYFAGWRLTATPHGELLNAPQQLPEVVLTTPMGVTSQDWLKRRWSLIYAPEEPCTSACVERLNRINQVRLALGKDMGRAQVVLLYSGAVPRLPDGADVTLGRFDDARGTVMAEFFEASTSGDNDIYITDPLGQLVIAYSSDFEQRELLEDLERLLAVQ